MRRTGTRTGTSYGNGRTDGIGGRLERDGFELVSDLELRGLDGVRRALELPSFVANAGQAWTARMGKLVGERRVPYAHAPAAALQQVVAIRVHLDDSTPDSGPLRVLPGTHTLGVLTGEAVATLARQVTPVDCVVPRGGLLLMRPLAVHASSKVKTNGRRRVVHIEYAASLVLSHGVELAQA